MNGTQMTLGKLWEKDRKKEEAEEGQKKREREKERVKGHEHVYPNGQGLQSRSVTWHF